jgi:hypothetical protein
MLVSMSCLLKAVPVQLIFNMKSKSYDKIQGLSCIVTYSSVLVGIQK